mmetsp:Transcript_23364/g.53483  ORF Transcript_23364/g.53483 Transcript_23364/m.53483 type:complete len:261 (+) Transcript_23364:257-1039(+)
MGHRSFRHLQADQVGQQALFAPRRDCHHRERASDEREIDRGRAEGHGAAVLHQAVPAADRTHNGRGGERARLLLLVATRQLRVGGGVYAAVWPRARRLQQPTPRGQGERRALRQDLAVALLHVRALRVQRVRADACEVSPRVDGAAATCQRNGPTPAGAAAVAAGRAAHAAIGGVGGGPGAVRRGARRVRPDALLGQPRQAAARRGGEAEAAAQGGDARQSGAAERGGEARAGGRLQRRAGLGGAGSVGYSACGAAGWGR